MAKRRTAPGTASPAAFLNVPYDAQYERLFLALLAISKSLSDLDGTQVYVHGATATGMLRQLTNALVRSTHQPTVQQLKAVYRDVRKAAMQIKKDHATNDLYDTRPFLDLVVAATRIAEKRIASLRES
jgi:hypothetical protein